MADFRKLNVWKKAHSTALNTYRVATKIRNRDHASLRSQIIRAAISVPTNLVEGRAQRTDKEFARFVKIALGSATELEYHLILGHDLGVVTQGDFQSTLEQVVDVKKMLTGLIDRLQGSSAASGKQLAVSS